MYEIRKSHFSDHVVEKAMDGFFNILLAERSTDNDSRRTVIHVAASAETPVDVIG